ncbi:MAG: glycoside hydrolase family 140 protein [Planctomycetota bacterium]
MRNRRVVALFIIILLIVSFNTCWSKSLQVGKSGRFLEYDDGAPFFYLGDTAWELFHRLNRQQADMYLANRAKKGFTVIQAVVLAERGGLDEPNPYGALPLKDNDPEKPNQAYFEHVDYIVRKAEELGLIVGMLPTWGKYWSMNNPRQAIFTEKNARSFGEFVGSRYRENSIIWILGGDHNIHTEAERRIVEAMASGLRAGDGGTHLLTFHPRGPGLSSDYFHKAKWLDFNMFQSSHGARDHDNGLFAEHDYGLKPAKPTLDGEPRYETIPVGYYFAGTDPMNRFDDYDCRQAAYWSLLAGACGHTYGHNSVWQMWAPGRSPVISAAVPWSAALDHPGAFQMGLVRRLFESRPFQKLVLNQSMIKAGPTSGGGKIRAASASDGSFAFVYSPRGEQFSVDKGVIEGTRVNEIWFDPRYGISRKIHAGDTKAFQTYTPPSSGRGCDWILILENSEMNFPLP